MPAGHARQVVGRRAKIRLQSIADIYRLYIYYQPRRHNIERRF